MDRLYRLAAEVNRGNRSAFDELYALTHKAVFLTAFGVLKDKMLAEDITQETYLAAFRGMEKDTLMEILRSYDGRDTVLSLGGGTVTTPECAEMIREKSFWQTGYWTL